MIHSRGLTREVDEDNEAAPWKEQENWEGEQIAKASMAVGAKDKAKEAQQYEYVFEDQIDFITDMALAGDVVRNSLFSQWRRGDECVLDSCSTGHWATWSACALLAQRWEEQQGFGSQLGCFMLVWWAMVCVHPVCTHACIHAARR